MRKVIGIDPGLASLGWAVLAYDSQRSSESIQYVTHGVIQTSKDLELSQRLLKLDIEFDTIMRRYEIREFAYEHQFFVKNVTSGLPVAHALGVILLYTAKHTIQVSSYTPPEVKKQITGNARSSKETVNKYVCIPLRLNNVTQHHAADALAVAMTHILKSQRSEFLTKAMQTQQEQALGKQYGKP